VKRRDRQHKCIQLDPEQLRSELRSSDENVRARAVRALCPCHAGWKPFEQNLELVSQLQKDASPIVRAAALHVFEDAAEIQSSGYPTNPREVSNEMIRKKRASRFPLEPEEIELRGRLERRS
jgi:hypothetical protein